MKKFLAILLVLVMVLPMCFVAQAGEIEPGTRPFYFLNWSAVEQYGLDNAFDIYMMWCRDPQPGDTSLYMTAMNAEADPTPVGHAEAMYEKFESYPEGTRYLYIQNGSMFILHEDFIFFEEATKLIKDYYKEMMTEYYILGGELDGMIYDFEYNPSQSFYISKELEKDPELFKRIVDNPRYQNEIRPMLVERGFKFWDNITDLTPEIYGVYQKSDRFDGEFEQSRAIWDAVMRDWTNQYMMAIVEPILKYFPDATVSDYRRQDVKSWMKTVHPSGGLQNLGGHINSLGGVTNENFYSYRPSIAYFMNEQTMEPSFNKPLGYNNAYFEPNAYAMLSWAMNDHKNMVISNEEGLMQSWLTAFNYASEGDTANPYSSSNTPYYTETILHIGMLDPQPFLGWVTEGSSHGAYAKSIKIISDILHELTRVVGAEDREPILTHHNWNYNFIMSGMYAGGRNVWRITPNIYAGTSVEAFKVEGAADPTFYIDGHTVTFPGGKIIENGSVYELGFCGYWVEMPADAEPVVTADVDRYEKYPAFQENYDQYEVGMEYTYDNVKPFTSWQFKKGSGATAVIQADKDNADNKVLALTGSFTLKNAEVTDKITAGDGRAENQAWEVTVTLPEKMGDKAEVTLLGIYKEDNFKAADGGIKIAGGKVYYADAENKYVEMDGVDVSKGGKFKVKRLVDLSNEEAMVSDYEIYDAEGKLLGSVKDVPFAKGVKKLPIEGIGLTCDNISGDPILIDNYKLYATGVTTDLELYEKHLGMPITDLEKPTNEEVVARLAWMNATQSEKEYAVVAAYYNGETQESEKTIQKVKMAPGTDAFEIVEIPAKEGKSVCVYLKDISKATDDDAGAEPTGLSVWAIVAICVGGVVVLAGAAFGVLLLLKKKKTAAAKQ